MAIKATISIVKFIHEKVDKLKVLFELISSSHFSPYRIFKICSPQIKDTATAIIPTNQTKRKASHINSELFSLSAIFFEKMGKSCVLNSVLKIKPASSKR